MKIKKGLLLLAALCLCASMASAGLYEGEMSYLTETVLNAPASGTVVTLDAIAGGKVSAGQALAEIGENTVFASADGNVARVQANDGDQVDGTVLEIAPTERYYLYCTVSKAYQAPLNTVVHNGETLYVKCSKNGTHRAVGIVNSVDGEEYKLETIGGTLYVGETVYLYRSPEFETKSCVGTGTVVQTDLVAVEATGYLGQVMVAAGDHVEVGQRLFTWSDGENRTLSAEVDGILTEVLYGQGETATLGQPFLKMVKYSDMAAVIRVDEEEIGLFHAGETITAGTDTGYDEKTYSGTVVQISDVAENGAYCVYIAIEGADWPLGLSLWVETAE